MKSSEDTNDKKIKALFAHMDSPVIDLEESILNAVSSKSTVRHSLDQYVRHAKLGLRVVNGCLILFILFIVSSLLDFPPGMNLLGDYTIVFAIGFAALAFLQFQIRDSFKGLI